MIRALYLANVSCVSGGCKRAYEISKRIKSYGVEYIPVTILTEAIEKPHSTDLNERYVVINRLHLRGFSIPLIHNLINYIIRLASREGVEAIISAHELPTYILTAYLASRTLKLLWSAVVQLPPKYSRSILGRVFYTTLFKTTLVMAVSYAVAEELWFIDGRLKNHTYVLKTPVGVDPKIYEVPQAEEEFDAIFYARLVREKGLFDIPLIWRKVVRRMPGARLAIAGPGDVYTLEMFKYLVKKLELEKNISYLGFLPREVLYSTLKASKVMIYPSHLDSFSMVVLEALAAGIPVVAYNIPAIKWNYRTRAVVKVNVGDKEAMANKALELLKNDELRSTLSIEAKRFASKFTWDNATAEEAYVVKKLARSNLTQLTA